MHRLKFLLPGMMISVPLAVAAVCLVYRDQVFPRHLERGYENGYVADLADATAILILLGYMLFLGVGMLFMLLDETRKTHAKVS